MFTTAFTGNDWQEILPRELPLLGHRNWIVVSNSANSLQTASGIDMIYDSAYQLECGVGETIAQRDERGRWSALKRR